MTITDRICRWGILSTAAIARKNWQAIANSGNGKVVAVASRSKSKAARFVSECQASAPVGHPVEALGSYEELLNRPDVDAVYIPLPTGLRTEWVICAANAGKHVMVEKPCGVTAANVQAMIDACEVNNVQFMDGVMFMHSARMAEIRRVLDDQISIGRIRRIASQFSFCADSDWVAANIRTSSSLEPAGCLGDLGWYTIRFSLWVMNFEMPVEVRGRMLHSVRRPGSDAVVPMEFQGELHFEDGTSATFFNSFRANHQQWVNVSGTNGYLHVNDFVLPYYGNEVAFEVAAHQFAVSGCQFNMERYSRRIAVPEYSNNAANAQETALFRNFSELVLSNCRDTYWPEAALKTQQVLDAALRSALNDGGAVKPG